MTKIPMPSPNEKRESIGIILQNAPEKPKSFLNFLKESLRLLGFRGLFFGVEDACFIALLVFAILGFTLLALPEDRIYIALFFFSPFSYALLYSLAIWKERMSGTWGITMACLITPKHLTAVRMLSFGGISMFANALLSGALYIWSWENPSFLRMLGTSFASLFLFAVIFLLLALWLSDLFAQTSCLATWCVLGIFAYRIGGVRLERLLLGLPTITLLGTALFLLILFLIEVNVYFKNNISTSH